MNLPEVLEIIEQEVIEATLITPFFTWTKGFREGSEEIC